MLANQGQSGLIYKLADVEQGEHDVVDEKPPCIFQQILVDDRDIVLAHIAHDVEFGRLVALHRAEMVEMLLEHIKQHAHARAVVHVFQLVRRELINHDTLRLDVFHDVETRNANVTRQDGVMARCLQHVVNQACRRALAFGTRDTDGLVVELVEEQVGLRGNLHVFRIKAQ